MAKCSDCEMVKQRMSISLTRENGEKIRLCRICSAKMTGMAYVYNTDWFEQYFEALDKR